MTAMAVYHQRIVDSFSAVVTLLAVGGLTHCGSYCDTGMIGVGGALVALVIVIATGVVAGSSQVEVVRTAMCQSRWARRDAMAARIFASRDRLRTHSLSSHRA